MYGRDFDWTAFRLTPARVFALSAILLVVAVVVTVAQFSQAENLILPAGAVIGGDYVAFDVAATAAREGRAAETYDAASFETLLKQYGPPKDRFGLTWQYPPTYFLAILPLAFLPYVLGYALWTGGSAALFLLTLRKAGASLLALFVILASPSAFQAAITGQNGFLTAALLLIAALYPNKRPILAGCAAAALTIKPHFGVLLPIAYLAGGCFRAFGAAAILSVVFALTATFAFGSDIWSAFLSGLTAASDNLTTAKMPLYKMATPYAAARFAGMPSAIALGFHLVAAAFAVAAVAIVWRRIKDAELRAAALIALAFFAAPYGFYYEVVILSIPLALLARRALAQGWLKHEQATLFALALLPMTLPGETARTGFSWGFLIVVGVALYVFRRIAAEEPQAMPFGIRPMFATAASPARSD
jgi:hypothetical protein